MYIPYGESAEGMNYFERGELFMVTQGHKIIATRRNEYGTITDVKLDNGTSMTKEKSRV